MKTPITYYGGKQKMAGRILSIMPSHNQYIEPFCGGAAVFFAKEPVDIETLNDSNGEIINFYKVVKDDFASLEAQIQATLYSRDAHTDAMVIYNYPHLFTAVQRAWAFWAFSQQSFMSILGKTWNFSKGKARPLARGIANKKTAFTQQYAQRLERVQLECADAVRVITLHDTATALFYCDPPYFNSDCGHYKGYTERDFIALLDALATIQGKFIVSSYPSPILSEYIDKYNWHTQSYQRRAPVAAISNKQRKTEVLTTNYKFTKEEV